jgi:hypothetical protein
MISTNRFTGLTMPVFSAFGWTGEETALNFAMEQLELFINTLYAILPRDSRSFFPAHGLDRESLSVYLAVNDQPETDLHIAFYARPMSLETSLILADKAMLNKAYKLAGRQSDTFHKLLAGLGTEWNLRLQQMEYESDAGTATSYQDLYKDSSQKLSAEDSVSLIERAVFLNGDDQWIIPLSISRRDNSEKVSAMGAAIVDKVAEYVANLMPLASLLTGQVKTQRVKTSPTTGITDKPRTVIEQTAIKKPSDAAKLEQFIYVSELKPLHIRRGFINLTSKHWPFFALNARTETRSATIKYDDKSDENCTVWRLVPSDQARIVLSPPVHDWLEENAHADDQIQITAIKVDKQNIEITLTIVD